MEFGGWEGEQTGDNTHLPVSNMTVCMPGPKANAICKSQCADKANPKQPLFLPISAPRNGSMAERNCGRVSRLYDSLEIVNGTHLGQGMLCLTVLEADKAQR